MLAILLEEGEVSAEANRRNRVPAFGTFNAGWVFVPTRCTDEV